MYKKLACKDIVLRQNGSNRWLRFMEQVVNGAG